MDKQEFKSLFDKYFDDIRQYVFYKTSDEDIANDVAQDVFMKVWEKRAVLHTDNIKALLYKLASDFVVDIYRKSDLKVDFCKNYKQEDENISPQENLQFEELKQRYADSLMEMDENQRETFLMNREGALTYPEIATRLEISVKTVEKRISAALKILKQNLLDI